MPSENVARLCEVTSTASRVLPIPPGPTSVNKRQDGSSSSAPISSISCDRPIKGVGVSAKLCILAILVLSYQIRLSTVQRSRPPMETGMSTNKGGLGLHPAATLSFDLLHP